MQQACRRGTWGLVAMAVPRVWLGMGPSPGRELGDRLIDGFLASACPPAHFCRLWPRGLLFFESAPMSQGQDQLGVGGGAAGHWEGNHTSSSKPPSGEAPSWLPFSRRQLSALEAHFSHSKTATLERRVPGADPLHPGEAHPPLWTGASTPFL
ncbi:hypothetical protein Cadr_000007330 [Camelus dromedarius]|uniref:Uncharacterized protein n=1 Tax=Camelus dromedarius TaxID=9838 RepID=A0A5N4E688_CAMDR|nr:hypothetical protein Cadr_000007330 [Camelus dromedarius]